MLCFCRGVNLITANTTNKLFEYFLVCHFGYLYLFYFLLCSGYFTLLTFQKGSGTRIRTHNLSVAIMFPLLLNHGSSSLYITLIKHYGREHQKRPNYQKFTKSVNYITNVLKRHRATSNPKSPPQSTLVECKQKSRLECFHSLQSLRCT